MNKTIDEKLKCFSERIVLHPEYTKALEKINQSSNTTARRGEPSSLLLTGESGTGKSTVCLSSLNQFGTPEIIKEPNGTFKTVPAFYCSLPAASTIKNLTIRMLQELGSTDTNGDNVSLTYKLVMLLKTCRTKHIFLDEFDNLLSKGAEKSRRSVCDWVRTLLNETLVPITLVGLPVCAEIVNDHPQLSRRYPYRHIMNPFNYASIDQASALSKTLNALGDAIREIGNFDNHINISSEHPITAIYLATGGNMNSIRILLHEAFESALLRNDGSFTIEDLACAFESINISTAKHTSKNPFRMCPDSLKKLISGAK